MVGNTEVSGVVVLQPTRPHELGIFHHTAASALLVPSMLDQITMRNGQLSKG